jgi:hypothetical protein
MKALDPLVWLQQKIDEIRKYTDRTIMVRPHPGAYKPTDFLQFRTKHYQTRLGVQVLEPSAAKLTDNLQRAHAAVFFNSSASVAAACAGIPIFVDDISCVSWAVANQDIAKIESPKQFDRQQWIYNLAAAHWSDDDANQGRIYQKFLPYLTRSTVTS